MGVNGSKCAYGMVTREMVTEIKNDVVDIKVSMGKLSDKMTELYNHQSTRPSWSVSVVISILTALVIGLGTYILTGR